MKTVTNAVFNVKDFVVNTLLKHTTEMSSWLGGGHTVDTDPTNRGWRMWNLAGEEGKRYEFVLVGRKGKHGCFMARLLDDGRIDVYTFTCDMADHVREVVMDNSILSDNKHGVEYGRIFAIDYHPGWALSIIADLEKMDNLHKATDAEGRVDIELLNRLEKEVK